MNSYAINSDETLFYCLKDNLSTASIYRFNTTTGVFVDGANIDNTNYSTFTRYARILTHISDPNQLYMTFMRLSEFGTMCKYDITETGLN